MELRRESVTKRISRKKIVIIGSLVAICSMGTSAIKVGDDLELESFLNARESGNFLSITRNVRFILPVGATMIVQQVKDFDSGNYGLLVKLTNGKHKGETAWVYYNTKNPALKLISDENSTGEDHSAPTPAPHEQSPDSHSLNSSNMGSSNPGHATTSGHNARSETSISEITKPESAPPVASKSSGSSAAPALPPASPPAPKDKVIATQPITATQNKPVEASGQLRSSKIDLESAFNCEKALINTQDWGNKYPQDFMIVPDTKLANGQTQVFIFNPNMIKSFPQGTFFLPGTTDQQAKDQFDKGSESLNDSSRAAIADYLRKFIAIIPKYVADFGKPNPDPRFPGLSPQKAIDALKSCTQVKDEPLVSSVANQILGEIEKETATPGGDSKTSTSHPAN